MKNIIIIGASSGGQLIAKALRDKPADYNIIGFLDVDAYKHGQEIFDV
mgnify:CR=1 FL=1